jgi:succinate-semialdehyde dehydrogenase/glutarate-semialdehyde dehydrogenase
MYIDGHWIAAADGTSFNISNPANGDLIGTLPNGGRDDAEHAISAAARAFPAGAARTAHERSAILYRAWQLMLERKMTLAELMTREQGKPLKAAQNEVQYAAEFLIWFAEEAKRVYGESIPSARADQRFLGLSSGGRRRRCNHAVELPSIDDYSKDRTCACCRLYRRAETC